jgi:hypothetical protein
VKTWGSDAMAADAAAKHRAKRWSSGRFNGGSLQDDRRAPRFPRGLVARYRRARRRCRRAESRSDPRGSLARWTAFRSTRPQPWARLSRRNRKALKRRSDPFHLVHVASFEHGPFPLPPVVGAPGFSPSLSPVSIFSFRNRFAHVAAGERHISSARAKAQTVSRLCFEQTSGWECRQPTVRDSVSPGCKGR